MDDQLEMTIQLMPSGYWLARWSPYLWIQWPKDRAPELSDGFGWITQRHVDEAHEKTLAALDGEGEK